MTMIKAQSRLPEITIWSPVTEMQRYYLTKYPTDEYQLANMFW